MKPDSRLPRLLALFGGPVVFVLLFLSVPDSYTTHEGTLANLGLAGSISAGLAGWMAVWWLTEAMPLSVTALLPLVVLPLSGAFAMKTASAPYAHPLIFLFLGGFLLALALERCGLHRRFALVTLRAVGQRPDRIVGGFMLVTALLSMWVSNTATAMMMLPIATSVLLLLRNQESENSLAIALFLGIAYAASIGGMGTLIGTPPNLYLASFAREHLHIEISFVRWLAIGIPFVVLALPLAWWLLTRRLFRLEQKAIPGAAELIEAKYNELGPMSRGERATLVVFLLTALAWVTRPLLLSINIAGVSPLEHLTDTGVALIAAVALFVVPGSNGPLMDWKTALRIPWGILLLFGGGLSLAMALDSSGLGAYLGSIVGSLGVPPGLAIVVVVTTLVVFLTELTSNTATATTLLPILAGIAPGMGLHPLLLAIPATLAASCAFMMPVATPPNAIVFGTGRVPISQMARAGLWLNIGGIVLITLVVWLLAGPVFGI